MRRIWMFLFLVFLDACTPGGERPDPAHMKNSERIFGGDEVEVQVGLESSLVMITLDDERGRSFVCTGTFISERLVLTASHCASKSPGKMRLLYGAAPFRAGAFIDVPIARTHLYHHITEDGAAPPDRHDLALIQLRDGLPAAATTLPLPTARDLARIKRPLPGISKANAKANKPLLRGGPLRFTAFGYGRIHGVEPTDASDIADAGVLRRVQLESKDYRPEAPTFTVIQLADPKKKERGVCFGDSGGPAVFELGYPGQSRKFMIGVASGVFSAAGVDEYAHGFDACKQHSIYMNILPYLPWIERIRRSVPSYRSARFTDTMVETPRSCMVTP